MIFDGHSDIFTDVTVRRLKGETQVLKNHHLPRLRKGNIEGGCFVLWIDPPYDADPAKRLGELMHCIKDEMAECEEAVVVKNLKEIEEARKAGKFYILPGLEGLSGIGTDLDKIDELYDFGCRHAMLSWNEQNDLSTGTKGDPNRGLTELGKKAVRKLHDKHMLVDVSHTNERTFWAGIIKSLFFAFIIASVSAFFGYTVDGGSIAVGKASTDSVVSSSVLILFAELVLDTL